MNLLDYQQVETLANSGIFWIIKNLDFLLKRHFAGDETAAGYIELLYVNTLEAEVVCE